jgi:hypothetical protein
MANVKISQLPSATTPLGGTEVLPIVQGTTTKKVSVAGLFTSPVMVTPTLGTPASGTATNLTGLPLTTGVTGILPVANGGNGTATPSLVAGSNVTITGTWPNQTIASTGGGGGGVTSFSAGTTGLTPATATTGAVTLAGTLAVANGGTGTATPSLVAGTNVSITGTWPNQTINSSGGGGGGMVYPGAGIPLSTGTAWGTSYNTTGTGDVVLSTSPTLVTPLLGTPTSGNFSTGTFTWPTFNQNTTGTAANVTGTVAIANGGTGQTTAAAAITALTGTQTAGQYLRSDGTNAALAAIQAADVPTLNQNTTGNAATATTATNVSGGTASVTTLSASGVATFSAGSAAAPAITTTGDTNTGIFFPAADTIAFSEGGVEAMRLDSAGNVGIGTSSPQKKFVVSDSGTTGFEISPNEGGSNSVRLIAFNRNTPAYVSCGIEGSVLTFSTTTGVGLSERMRIDSSGNIGIGTNSPGAKLAVVGTGYSPNITLTDAATVAWDTTTGQVATFTFVSSNRTMGAPTNLVNGGFYGLAVIQNAGSNTLTWNSVFKWANGTAPTLSTAASAKDYFVFRSDGTNLYEQGRSQGVA